MRNSHFILALFLLMPLQSRGSDPAPFQEKVPSVASTWPGVDLQIPEIDRIEGNRLLVVVRLSASPGAPASTLIGTPAVVTADDIKYHRATYPTPFSLYGATMVDDLTQQKYESLRPLPGSPAYRASTILTSLVPGQGFFMTVQFTAPPPILVRPGAPPAKQTVSFLLPRAKGLILNVPIPAPHP